MTSNEPVAIGAAIQGLIAAVLAILTAFEVWTPTEAQTAAIFGLWVALTAVIAIVVRAKVTPTSAIDTNVVSDSHSPKEA